MTRLSIVGPEQIEAQSFQTIEREMGDCGHDAATALVVKRVIHATADFDYARTLRFSPHAVEAGIAALSSGAHVVTDTQMAAAGINKRALEALGGKVHTFIGDADVAREAKRRGVTRSSVCMERAAKLEGPLIVAVGNAPTALVRLVELVESGEMEAPALVVGVPVGFVNVVEAKELVMGLDVDYIVAQGRKGGSSVAAAICNALLYQAVGEKEPPTTRDERHVAAVPTPRLRPFFEDFSIPCANEAAATRARERWNAIAKPVGSLGLLEEAVVRIAALTGSEHVDVSKRCVVTFCADNGVVEQGVSPSGADVTRVVAGNVARGISSVCRMCAPVGADNMVVDMGMFEPLPELGILDRRIAAGTRDISQGPAMTREQALQGIRAGVDLVGDLVARGYRLIGTGEMGIGNTTTATAMACVLTGLDVHALTGPGAGLPKEGVARKEAVIRRAIAVNAPDASDPLDVLAKLGGFDIAAMCGMFLGGALHRVPVIIDGLISSVAATCALRMRPESKVAMFASHMSAEPAAVALMDELGLQPPVHAQMRLGEGTGTPCLMALLDLALSVYENGPTLRDCGITSYQVEDA